MQSSRAINKATYLGMHRASMAPYTATSMATPSIIDNDVDEVLSTDTTEALRDVAMKRADMHEDDNPGQAKTPPMPMGLLAIHLLQIVQFDQSAVEMNLIDPDVRFQILISISDMYKWTGPKKGQTKMVQEKEKHHRVLARVAVDEVKHFSMRIPQQTGDSKNVLKFELYGTHAKQGSALELIGSVEVHLHELIKAMLIIDVLPLIFNKRIIASLELELAFLYGSLGFGYSTQLENPGFDPARDLARSMFPRVSLPEDRDGEVLTPTPCQAPSFVPWTCRTITHWDENVERVATKPWPRAPAQFSDQIQGAINQILVDYLPLNSRGKRLDFLRRLVRGTPQLGQQRSAGGSDGPQAPEPPSGGRGQGSSGGGYTTPTADDQRTPAPSAGGRSAQLPPTGGREAPRTVQPTPAAASVPATTEATSPSGPKPPVGLQVSPHTHGTSTSRGPAPSINPVLSTSTPTKLTAPKQIMRVRRPPSSASGTGDPATPRRQSSIDLSVENVTRPR